MIVVEWTRTPPTVEGWYWCRNEDDRDDAEPKRVWMSAPDTDGGPLLCAIFGNPEFGGQPVVGRDDFEWWPVPIVEPPA